MTTVEQLISESVNGFFSHEKKASKKPVDTEELKKIASGLEKVASLPYKQEAYEAVCGIMKLASEAINGALSALQDNKNQINELEKLSAVRSIIDELLERELISKMDVQEKTAELLKKNEQQIEVVKEAMKMTTNNITGNIFSDEGSEKTASAISGEKRGIFDGVI